MDVFQSLDSNFDDQSLADEGGGSRTLCFSLGNIKKALKGNIYSRNYSAIYKKYEVNKNSKKIQENGRRRNRLGESRKDEGMDALGNELQDEGVDMSLGAKGDEAREDADVGGGSGKRTVPVKGDVAGSAGIDLQRNE